MKDRIHKKFACLSFLLLLFITYGVIAAVTTESVHGETVTQVVYSGNGTITANGNYQLANDFTGTITIANGVTDIKIIGSQPSHTHLQTNISVSEGRSAELNLTIEDLKMEASDFAHGIDFGSSGSYDHKLYLSGVSRISGGSDRAGIHVPNDISLIINSAAGETEGEINVTGGSSAAGIGGGAHGEGGTISIAGGTVTATGGGHDGAGIGGGIEGSGGTITITGGTVTATGGGGGGAGIGGGFGGSGGTITITGGTVTATGGHDGAGIGGGIEGSGGTITITGGTVTATGGSEGGAGIGGSFGGSGGNITITGGTVKATGNYGAGIGGGGSGSGGTITITGGTVTATGSEKADSVGGYYGAGIGGGYYGAGGFVSIRGINTNVTATGKFGGIDIGSGRYNLDGGTLEVLQDATVNIINTNAQMKLTLSSLTADPETETNTLDSVNLTVNIDGIFFYLPQGEVSFKVNGTEIQRTTIIPGVDSTSGSASINVDNLPGDTYTFLAEYVKGESDRFYCGDQLKITNYVVNKSNQDSLIINIPDIISYGDDPFDIEVSGGSGTGAISYEITFGNVITVDDTGRVTIVAAGTAEVTVTKAGDNYYNQVSTIIPITVNKAIPPTVSFPTTETIIIYGQKLGDVELIGGSGDGSFAWLESNTIPIVGDEEYTVVFTPTNRENYVVLEQTVSVTVTPKALTITAEDKTKVYGEADPELTVTYTGLIQGEDASNLGGELVVVREEGEEVGTYTITPSGLTSDNYTITFEETELIITPKNLTITAENKSKVYGEADPELTVTYTGLIQGEDASNLGGELVVVRAEGEEVGTYTITPSGLTSTNYNIKFDTGTLRILNNNLSSLALSNGSLNPTFSSDATSYTASVTNSVSSITITPEAEDNNATIKVNNQTVTSGQASEAVALNVGANTIVVEVIAEDGVTVKTYTITINRAAATTGGGGGTTTAPSTIEPPANSGASNTVANLGADAIEKQTTTASDGKKVETFSVRATAAQQQLAAARNEGMTSVEIKIESNPEATTIVNIPAEVLQSANDMTLTVTTQYATLEIPPSLVKALAAAGQRLSFSIEGGNVQAVQSELEGVVQGEGALVVDTPTVIHTELKGETTVTLPLEGITFPEDPQERQRFLERLAIFIIHSDGEKKIITGEIDFDANGNPVRIKIAVDKFSIFTIIKLPEPLKQTSIISLTIGQLIASKDGKTYTLDAAPFINQEAGRTLVPVRFISEILGARVEWLEESKQVSIIEKDTEIILTIGSDAVIVNNNTITLDCPAEILSPGRTFVPLRFVSEVLGADVEWDKDTQTITISR